MATPSGPISSYKSVIDYFQTLALSHLNVQQFKVGQLSDLDVENNTQTPTKYPMVFMLPQRSDLFSGGKIEFTFALNVVDITNYDLVTEQDQLNTTFMILQDIISRIRRTTWNQVDLNIQVPITARPFVEVYNNNLAGWSAVIRVEVMTPFNNCDAAFNDN